MTNVPDKRLNISDINEMKKAFFASGVTKKTKQYNLTLITTVGKC